MEQGKVLAAAWGLEKEVCLVAGCSNRCGSKPAALKDHHLGSLKIGRNYLRS